MDAQDPCNALAAAFVVAATGASFAGCTLLKTDQSSGQPYALHSPTERKTP